jgi:NADPH2:quinone reductase
VRAYTLRRHGGPDVLALTDVPSPRPGEGEVAVDVEAIGINYAEVLSRKGLYGWAPAKPYVPGMEVAGVVSAVGPGVAPERVGQRVMVGMQHGGYAERVVVRAAQALPALEGLSLVENAAFAVNYMTAWVSLMEMARLRPSDRVLITAAAGGVGTAAVRIASAFGCDVVALAGSPEKLRELPALGAHHTVSYRADGWQEALAETLDGRGPDVVLEVVGGEVYRTCLAALAPFGRLVVAGYAGLDYSLWKPWTLWSAWRGKPRADVIELALGSTGVLASHIGYLLGDEARLEAVWRDLVAFAGEHGLRPVVGHTYAFEDLPEAHRLMESRKSVGKIVVTL